MPRPDDDSSSDPVTDPGNGKAEASGLDALMGLVAELETKLGGCSTEIAHLKEEQRRQGLDLSEIKSEVNELGKLFRHKDGKMSIEVLKQRNSWWSEAFSFGKTFVWSPGLIIFLAIILVIAVPTNLAISISWQRGLVIGAPDIIGNIEMIRPPSSGVAPSDAPTEEQPTGETATEVPT